MEMLRDQSLLAELSGSYGILGIKPSWPPVSQLAYPLHYEPSHKGTSDLCWIFGTIQIWFRPLPTKDQDSLGGEIR